MPRLSEDSLRRMLDSWAVHADRPHESVEQLLIRRKSELASWVLSRRRVYLDTRFWIFLRDAAMGAPQRSVHSTLLDLLKSKVASGEVLCPLNESAIFELIHQEDPEKRAASVRLMDALSMGVVIQNTVERIKTEAYDFLSASASGVPRTVPPLEHVWLKVGHFVGTPVPAVPALPRGDELAGQKAFLDLMWSLTLEEVLGNETDFPDARPMYRKLAVQISNESARHEKEMRSFKGVFEAELAGFWDLYEDQVHSVLVALYLGQFPEAEAPPPEAVAEQVRLYKNALRNVVTLRDVGSALGTAQVTAGLHAIVRWNRNRGFKDTDFYDFHHAAAAMPYCDLFLTERFLTTMLCQPPLDHHVRFETRVTNDPAEALSMV